MDQKFDIIIIGSGPGGYVAAIRASQLGYKVAIIEKYSVLGGTCANVGCIPSKALLDSSELYSDAIDNYQTHGIEMSSLNLNFNQFIGRKKQVVKDNNIGLSYLMQKNKIEVVNGIGKFISKNEIEIKSENNSQTIIGSYIILATGSKPSTIEGIVIDKKRIITSTEALSLNERPKSMVIIGGGAIGVELASIYSRIGTKTTIIEHADTLIPTMDKELGIALLKILRKKKNIQIFLNARIINSENTGQNVVTQFYEANGNVKEIISDYTLVSVGRKPYTEGLHIEKVKIKTDSKGFISVNEKLQTSVDNIYAIGDVIGGAMLAHKAQDEGNFVAEIIAGQKPNIKYKSIPNVVYTWPEIASVGYTEEELKLNDAPFRVGKYPFSALGRARAAGEKNGFVKVLADPKYGEILGVHIIGPRAADLIAQVVTSMEYEVTDTDLSQISYAHPTYSEALKEAFLDASGIGAINL